MPTHNTNKGGGKGLNSIEKVQHLNRDPGSCAKQHFIDDGCVAGMTLRGSGQAVSFCDFNPKTENK